MRSQATFGVRRVGLILALCLARPAPAMIQRMYSLDQVLKECTHVFVGRIEKVDGGARAAVASIGRALKGEVEYRRINMNLGLGPSHHAAYLLDRLKVGAPALVFYQRKGTGIACLVHAADTWYQLFATDDPKKRDKVWWRFTHIEAYMGRTFNGPTTRLIELTGNVLAGRVKPPRPDPKVPVLEISRSSRKPAKAPRVRLLAGKAGGFRRQVHFRASGGKEVRGVSFADVNGDELLDLLVCRTGGNLLLVNEGKGFKEMSRAMGLSGGCRSAAWADYNGDDHPDLLTSNFELFTNVGGRLRNDSRLLRVPRGRNPEGAGWIDYNGDGRPDVLVTNGEHGIRLYENTGKGPGWFRDVSDKVGLGRKGFGAGNGDFVAFFDYDGDGYTDFLYNLSRGVLARNRGDGGFRLETSSGIELPGGSGHKRGISAADFDNDGDLDLFVPAPGRPRLYRNNNDGSFTDVLAASGDLAGVKDASFAAAWGDVNGDGWLDLFVCHTRGRARLYLGDGQGRFSDVTRRLGVEKLSPAWGAAFADVDGDGDLDLVANLSGKVVVAYNDLARPRDRRLVTVHVQARRGLIGAVVRVLDEGGRLLGLRELNGGESCGGQACPVGHFSLPRRPCRLSVALSDGRVAQRSLPVEAKREHLTVRLAEADFK